MRRAVIVLFCFFNLFGADDKTLLDSKIENNKQVLEQKAQEYQDYTQKIGDSAKEIMNLQNELINFDNKILSIDKILEQNKMSYELKKKELVDIQLKEEELVKAKKETEQRLITLIARDLSVSVVINNKMPSNITDLIKEEIFFAVGNITRDEIRNLKQSLNQTQSELEEKRDSILNIKRYIDDLDDKKSKQIGLKNDKQKLLDELSVKNEQYRQQLAGIIAKQNSIKSLIEQLLAEKETITLKESSKEELQFDVRQIGNSYQKVKTVKYTGSKTIAPLESYKVTTNFGTYYDEIYKMKIFNESVTLKSNIQNAKVRSILDGKIAFKGENSILGKVIIIKHNDNLHSIYGYLSQFAPNVDVGSRVNAGSIIGRIKDELSFEVTKKDYHINPLDVIEN